MDRNSDGEECVSLRLVRSKASVEPNTIVDTSFRLIIYDQSYGKHSEHHGKVANCTWGKIYQNALNLAPYLPIS
jgi:hypothetical protein